MKILDIIRGTSCPSSETIEGWEAWERKAKTKHPWRFWFVEVFLPKFSYGGEKLRLVKHYFINRFVDRTHVLSSRLPRGQYHEIDTRILNCLFDSLVDFVEGELAWLHAITNTSEYKVKKFRLKPYRNKDAGLAHLAWEATIRDDDGELSQQAVAALELKKLYDWWTTVYPNRIDPYVYHKSERYEEILKLEKAYRQEEEDMLIALIKLRGSLWT